MKYQKKITSLFLLIIFGLLSQTAGCRSVTEFLFPGKVSTTDPGNQTETPAPPPVVQPKETEVSIHLLVSHKPYLDRKCEACHQGAEAFTTSVFGDSWDGIFRKGGGKPGPLTLPVRKLCLKCHVDLSVEWAQKRGLHLHKTAADGDCIKCHVPHQGRHPHRLIVAETQLCAECHNIKDKIGLPRCVTKLHVTGPCLSCHNAHLGKTKALLKKDYEEPKHTVSELKGGTGGHPASAEADAR